MNNKLVLMRRTTLAGMGFIPERQSEKEIQALICQELTVTRVTKH